MRILNDFDVDDKSDEVTFIPKNVFKKNIWEKHGNTSLYCCILPLGCDNEDLSTAFRFLV